MSNLIFPLPLLAKVQPQSSEPSGALATQRALAPSPPPPASQPNPSCLCRLNRPLPLHPSGRARGVRLKAASSPLLQTSRLNVGITNFCNRKESFSSPSSHPTYWRSMLPSASPIASLMTRAIRIGNGRRRSGKSSYWMRLPNCGFAWDWSIAGKSGSGRPDAKRTPTPTTEKPL